jgi:nucleotide-binding universal stress UspA family protein
MMQAGLNEEKESEMFKHILVPTDGSELSQDAVRFAVSFAKEIGAKITAFYAKPEYPVTYYGEGVLIDTTSPEKFAELAETQAQEILAAAICLCQKAEVPCDKLTTTSDVPYEGIIEAATNSGCDLIFMASHGRRGFTSLLLGSEAQKVLKHSTIPVLVYRTPRTD